MAIGDREIRLRVRIDDSGIGNIQPAQFERAGQTAGENFARGFRRGADGATIVDRGSGPAASYSQRMFNQFGPSAQANVMNRIAGTAAGQQQLNDMINRGRTLSGVFASAGGGLRGIISQLPNLASGVYLFSKMTGAVRGLVGELKSVGIYTNDAVERSRRLEAALAGTTGFTRARQLNYALTNLSRSTPADVAELRETATIFSSRPQLAGQLLDADAAQKILKLNRLIQRLSVLDPEQSVSGSRVAVSELLEGGGADAFCVCESSRPRVLRRTDAIHKRAFHYRVSVCEYKQPKSTKPTQAQLRCR